MNYPISTVAQLKAVLRALRKDQQLSQAELGQRIGVNQKRVAKIEASPGVTSFDQIARITSALGARIVIQRDDNELTATGAPAAKKLPAQSRRVPKSAPTW